MHRHPRYSILMNQINQVRTMIILTLAACLLAVFAPRAEAKQDFSYYQYILSRQPLGCNKIEEKWELLGAYAGCIP